MDPDDFLDWEIRQERRHELIDGVVTNMAGASRAHQMIQVNVALAFRQRLRGTQCMARLAFKIKIPNKNWRYADVVVDCGANAIEDLAMDDLIATGPHVVLEVESPTTSALAEMDRLRDDQLVATIEHIVILAQHRPFARVWTRTAQG
jgi:Uma2 family endonuclease